MTKALYDTVGNEYMIPPTDPKQDCWTFLWHEGEVIHIQIWDRSLFYSIEHDGYMGNVSFPLHINKAGPQKVEGVVHSGPTGHLRSKAKVFFFFLFFFVCFFLFVFFFFLFFVFFLFVFFLQSFFLKGFFFFKVFFNFFFNSRFRGQLKLSGFGNLELMYFILISGFHFFKS